MRFVPYRVPLRTPIRGMVERAGFVVLVGEGRGEAAPLPGHGTEDLAACEEALRASAARVRPVDDVAGIAALLDGMPPAARCGVELALLDDLGRRRGVPVARLLDSDARTEVAVSALLSATEPAALAREARALVQEGFGTLKLKVAQAPLDGDLARVAVVRDAVGPEVRIRVDANGGWDEATALQALRRLVRLDLELCEQPVLDLAAMRRLRGATAVPIAADESLADPAMRAAAIAAADVLVLKPMVLGGLLPALLLARRSRRPAIVTTSLDGVIARLGAAHLAAAIRARPKSGTPYVNDRKVSPNYAAGLATGRLLVEDLCEDPAPPAGGKVRLPDKPGLGFS
jgi:L-Ala-D/L-Glu epimerase